MSLPPFFVDIWTNGVFVKTCRVIFTATILAQEGAEANVYNFVVFLLFVWLIVFVCLSFSFWHRKVQKPTFPFFFLPYSVSPSWCITFVAALIGDCNKLLPHPQTANINSKRQIPPHPHSYFFFQSISSSEFIMILQIISFADIM